MGIEDAKNTIKQLGLEWNVEEESEISYDDADDLMFNSLMIKRRMYNQLLLTFS